MALRLMMQITQTVTKDTKVGIGTGSDFFTVPLTILLVLQIFGNMKFLCHEII